MSRVFKVDYIPDPDRGRPLWNAKIFVGVANQDPTIPSNQIQLTGDIGFPVGQSIPVPQPVRTNAGGITVYNNSPLDLNAPGQEYAIQIFDRNDNLIYNFPQVDGSVVMNTTSQEEVTGLTIWPEVGEAVIGQTIPSGTDAIRYPFNGRSTLFTIKPPVAVTGTITNITINSSGIGELEVDNSDVYDLAEFNSFIAANDGDSQLAGGNIWPLSSQESSQDGQTISALDRFLRVNGGDFTETEILEIIGPSVGGVISALTDTKPYSASIGGIPVSLKPRVNTIQKTYATLDEAINSGSLLDGMSVSLSERTEGNGGGAIWDVVLTSTITPNTYNIVQSVTDPSLSLVLRASSILSSKAFGLKCDGTDETAAMQAMRDYIADNPNVELWLDEGLYIYTTSPNWAIRDSVVKAIGQVTFRCTGTGDCLIFDDPTGTTFNLEFTWDNPIRIEGDDNTGRGVFWRSCHHSKLGVNVRGCGGNFFESNFAVVNEWRLICSINQGPFYSATAPAGARFTQRNAGEATSANTIYNPIVEGMRGIGMFFDEALMNTIIGGTSEGNVGANVECSVNSRVNTFIKIDLEVSGSSQGFIDRGRWNIWDGILNDANSTITSTAVGTIVRGGLLNAIVNQGAYTSFDTITYGANGGSFTDTGTFTTEKNSYNIVTASILRPNRVQGKIEQSYTVTTGAWAAPSSVPGTVSKIINPTAFGLSVGDIVTLSPDNVVSGDFILHAYPIAANQLQINYTQISGAATSPHPGGAVFTVKINGV